ncbi:hypothetical protein [uncultured Fusobacterium sp.]|uniref:hypothetical protein n=1 Tax=uncultured Fusobacterium sp. TaxID=159267 RepID=UPI002598C39F|nr:hypothetical protein [uncultured Fusobacterium sp.]
MSPSLRAASKVVKQAQEKVKEAKDALKKYGEQSVKSGEQLKEAKAKVAELTRQHGKNSDEVKEAQKQVEKYKNEVEEANRKIKEAKEKVRKHTVAISENNKKIKEGQKTLEGWGKKAIGSIDSVIAKTMKFGMAMVVAAGIFAGTTGFSQAFDMEGYKMQLTTAVKSTEKAGELMVRAVKYANSTPFETGEVIEATAKMEAMGASSIKWLGDVADMAGATNKGMIQATEAMIAARKGEFERLKEFGIDKELLMAEAAKKYGRNVVFNKRGQIKDRLKLEETLQSVMKQKFEGGADKQAKTFKGLWSTITGVTKAALAKIVGMNEDGTIKQGSLYEKLKEKMELVVAILNKWMEDGTIDRIADGVTAAVGKMIEIFKGLYDFISKYRTWIEAILIFVGTVYSVVKVFTLLKAVIGAVTIVIGLLNGTLTLTPLGAVALAVGALVTAGYLLYKNWEIVVSWGKSLWDWLKNLVTGVSDFKLILTGPIAPLLLLIKHFEEVKEMASKAWGFIKNIFGVKDKEISLEVDEKNKTVSKRTNKDSDSSIVEKKQKNNFKIKETKDKEKIEKNEYKKNFTSLKVEKQKKIINSESETKIKAEKSIKKNEGITVIIKGDVYGFDDFKEKVAEAIIKLNNVNKSNVVGG